MIAALIVYAGAVAADCGSTWLALRAGLREANPLLRLAGRFWLHVRLALGLVVAVAAGLAGAEWALWLASGIYFAVGVSNLWLTRRAR